MSSHLPECEMSDTVQLHDAVCSCVRLAKCAERTRREERDRISASVNKVCWWIVDDPLAEQDILDAIYGRSNHG